MTAKDPFDLKVISDVLQIEYDSLRRWVRDCILKIESAGVLEELHGKDFKDWQLSLWIKHAREHRQKPFNDFCSMIENNREYIVNYFDRYRTNAIAESTNAKI